MIRRTTLGAIVVLGLCTVPTAAPGSEARAQVAPPELALAHTTPTPSAASEHVEPIHIPRATRRLLPSAHFDVRLWQGAFQTHTLLDDAGGGAVPVSEARFLWREDALYVRFYAGDLDLQVYNRKPDGPTWNDDSFTLTFYLSDQSARLITVSATGIMADGRCPADASSLADPRCDLHWQSRARIGFDYDGTLNQLGDHDEEWNIELAIPLRSLGVTKPHGAHIAVALRRCEIAYDGARACGQWGSERAPKKLMLD